MISIVLPNLNTPINFLEERINSIINQSYKGWDCIIVDGFSDNGSAEYLKLLAERDCRFKFYQRPRKGIYDAWNEGIKLTENEFVYIATSDDTMTSDFFYEMLLSFSKAPNCGIACCHLTLIDENSDTIDEIKWEEFSAGKYFNDILNSHHIRKAPHDGILHTMVGMVYTSITQLLIKKSVFEKVGLFLVDCGSIADYEWEMRAALIYDVVYTPKKMATWRKYLGQATLENYNNKFYYNSLLTLIQRAFSSASNLDSKLPYKITLEKCLFSFSVEKYRFGIKEANGFLNKTKEVFQCMVEKPSIALLFILESLNFKKRYDHLTYAKQNLKYFGIEII